MVRLLVRFVDLAWFASDKLRTVETNDAPTVLTLLDNLGSHPSEPTNIRRLPMTRADCPDPKDGPCPYVTCRHHLFLDVNQKTGEIRFTFPDAFDEDGAPELGLMPATCSLDAADEGAVTLEVIGQRFDITRERARQLEERALERLRTKLASLDVTDYDVSQTTTFWDNAYIGTVRAD